MNLEEVGAYLGLTLSEIRSLQIGKAIVWWVDYENPKSPSNSGSMLVCSEGCSDSQCGHMVVAMEYRGRELFSEYDIGDDVTRDQARSAILEVRERFHKGDWVGQIDHATLPLVSIAAMIPDKSFLMDIVGAIRAEGYRDVSWIRYCICLKPTDM